MMFYTAEEKHLLRRAYDESNARLLELERREQECIADKRYYQATQIAYLRMAERKKNNQILGQLTGAL